VNPDLPLTLARLHQSGPFGSVAPLRRKVPAALLEGAGLEPVPGGVRRLRTLPDIVGPGMRVLVCGLNPSLYAADAGVHYGRPGNRFWPAALAAGLVSRDRDPWHALEHHRVGWTDLVKRATVSASELAVDEFVHGAERLHALVAWLAPRVVCFVGLTGWRAAVDRRAGVGLQGEGFAGAAAYVMPNTSGLNAHFRPADFADHLSAVVALAETTGCPG
jgi:TDG/mug DNA glycosylase family protein